MTKVLVANRGEVAVRIIRAAKELGIKTVAVYSEADRGSLATKLADEAYCIGPGPSTQSYLNIPNIISAAMLSGADAIHPGYGFLAENPYFAEICESHGLKFIGPSARVMNVMGDKAEAKRAMAAAGLPVIPGTSGVIQDEKEALAFADEYGFPVMVKAAAGGGGKGMRAASSRQELVTAIRFAQAEAEAAFGVAGVYLEKILDRPRHVEVQLLVDEDGHAIHLGERDCSVQRKHQKLIEESPSPVVDDRMRKAIGDAAVRGALAVGYTNAGTMEFLVDSTGAFYFMEMNTRVQVEHPVTELVTGIDIVKAQFMIAAGESIAVTQNDIVLSGHAIECRINAEDPSRSFMPSPGRVSSVVIPGGPGVRVDTALFAGCTVPPYYDSLIAKVAVWGRDRAEAIERMSRALEEIEIEGICTNVAFQRRLIRSSRFREAEIYCNDDVLAVAAGNSADLSRQA
ncbi:MAG TPA: acetyl-CoA carboxylase biotin carboxylase subunit [Firmicutes bacterium]|nr:acetyl-CoA carboxylase biotin carboxylase subunit [Bacillota bacterium]